MGTITSSWETYASKKWSTSGLSVTFQLQARYTGQDIANNTTTIQTRLRTVLNSGSGGGYPYKFTCSYCSTVSGSSMWYFATENITTSSSKTISHNSDGTKTVSLSASASVTGLGLSVSLSASVSLPTIARYPVLTSGQNFTDESAGVTMTFTNPRKTNPIRLKLEAGGNPDLIVRDFGSTVTSGTIELTDAERNTLRALAPNSNTLSVRETVRAMSGATPVSLSYKDYTMTIVNANPTFTATYQDTNASTIAITGDNQKIIQNQSTLQINVADATAYKSATLSSIKAEINGITYTTTLSGSTATFNIGTLDVSQNINALITLTDSRGNTTTQTLSLEVLAWSLPTANITLERQNNYYSATDITVDANYSSLDGQNTINIYAMYKKTTDSTYSTAVVLQDNVTATLNLDNLYEWDVQVVLTDRLGTTTYNLTVGKGMPIIYFDRLKRSVGIDCFPNDDESIEAKIGNTQINLAIRLNEIVDYIIDSGTTSGWKWRKWKSGMIEMTGFVQYTGITCTSSSAGTYYGAAKTTTIPFSLASYEYIGTQEQSSRSSGIYVYVASISGNTISVEFRTHASGSNQSCGVRYYIRGTLSS